MLYKYVNICIPQSMKLAKWAILRLLQGSHWIRSSNIFPKVFCLNYVSMLFMLLDPIGVHVNLSLRRVTESSNWISGIQRGCRQRTLILDPENIWTQILSLVFAVCVILDSVLNLSGPQFSLLENKENDFWFTRWLERLMEIIFGKWVAQCLEHTRLIPA